MANPITKKSEEDKKVLVFLHYFGGSANSWDKVIAALQDEFRCIAINIPGFGGTASLQEPSLEKISEFILSKLSFLMAGKYTLIGHSMGAKIAYQMALRDQNVEGLILICPSPPGIEPIEDNEKQRMLNHPNLEEAKTTVNNITRLPLSTEQYDLAIENNLNADREIWNWWLNHGMTHSLESEVKNIEIPISILMSEDDPVITPKIIAERVMTVFSDAKLISTNKSGHLIPMEKPNWIAEQIRRFLKD